jgi:hypothetical protein
MTGSAKLAYTVLGCRPRNRSGRRSRCRSACAAARRASLLGRGSRPSPSACQYRTKPYGPDSLAAASCYRTCRPAHSPGRGSVGGTAASYRLRNFSYAWPASKPSRVTRYSRDWWLMTRLLITPLRGRRRPVGPRVSGNPGRAARPVLARRPATGAAPGEQSHEAVDAASPCRQRGSRHQNPIEEVCDGTESSGPAPASPPSPAASPARACDANPLADFASEASEDHHVVRNAAHTLRKG